MYILDPFLLSREHSTWARVPIFICYRAFDKLNYFVTHAAQTVGSVYRRFYWLFVHGTQSNCSVSYDKYRYVWCNRTQPRSTVKFNRRIAVQWSEFDWKSVRFRLQYVILFRSERSLRCNRTEIARLRAGSSVTQRNSSWIMLIENSSVVAP